MRHIAFSMRALLVLTIAACASSGSANMSTSPPKPDPRVGLKPGMFDAGIALWNMKLVSTTPPSEKFKDGVNTDMAFYYKYVIQGNYSGFQVWDISDPAKPKLTVGFVCPASQSDVSVYKNLLFVSAEGMGGRTDCGTEGVHEAVSTVRMRGIRVFDVSDLAHPKYIASVQTCRGSHTHTLVVDPKDTTNVYIYVSGSAGVRSPAELPGCSSAAPDSDAGSSRFRIEVIKVPVAHPEQAAIVSSARIFGDLKEAATHPEAPEDIAAAKKKADSARAAGGYTAMVDGVEEVISARYTTPMLDSIVAARHGTGAPTAADSAALRAALQGILNKRWNMRPAGVPFGVLPGPDQCHDITVYVAIGRAGGACEGYGMLLDITDVAHPKRIYAVSDTNFSYWHSATFNNDGTALLFSDEWGGGGAPKCRATDRPEWGADAIFTLAKDTLHFRGYYKMLAPQTSLEVCVAHNGSLIPIPGRDVMVQSWYEGGISVFDFTDPSHAKEIAFFDRGPSDSTKLGEAGTWSAYWYNGNIISSEIARGLDILELTPSGLVSQNEIDAAKTAHLDYLNVQSQPRYSWPATYALAGAYLDQLVREDGLQASSISGARKDLERAQRETRDEKKRVLTQLAANLNAEAGTAKDGAKVRKLASVVAELARAGPMP